LRGLITDINQNPQNTGEDIVLFYQVLNQISMAHAKTWKDSQEDLNRFLGNDGTPQLARFEVFNSIQKPYLIGQLNAAVGSPDPTRILVSFDEIAEGYE